VALMLIFSLTVNLMKYKHWIKTCVIAFVVPTAVVAFIGIAQYLLGLAPYGWIDEALFSGITARSTSVFGNPNVLGAFLATLLPMALTYTLSDNNPRVRTLGMIVSVFMIVCTVFTYSRSAWLALVVGGILFATLITPKGILWIFPTAGATALAAVVFPDTFGSRIVNFLTLADSANSYRVSVWNSSWKMFIGVIGGGVGMGEEAFKTGYLNFAESGTETVMHSHSLYLQIGIQLGLIGLLLFIFAVASISVKCTTTLASGKVDKGLSVTVKACLSGAVALLTAGVFDYTWYNFRIMFIFWALLGIACASVNIDEREHRTLVMQDYDERSAFVAVAIPSRSTVENNKQREEMKDE
ncbi:MAG: O-antigen ligase family protein, partial [Eubacteriales bacterium]